MKCSRCGAEMKIKNVKVDTDIYGNAIYHKYAYCYHCKIKRNLGPQKATSLNSRKLSAKRARKRRRKLIFLTVFLILLLTVLAGAGIFFLQKNRNRTAPQKETVASEGRRNKINAKSFSKLETGMTRQEVFDIIGNNGNKLMQTASDDSASERYQWTADRGNGAVLLTFKDEKLINISQVDMKESASAKLSADSLGKVKYGMTYKEVAKELGTDGTLISETVNDGVTNALYTWYDSASKIKITVVFQNDKVQSAH